MDLASRGRVSSLPISRLRKAGLRAHCARPAFCNRAPTNLRSIAPRRQKKAQVPVASGASGSIARTRARTPRHRPGNARRTRRTIRTSRTRVSRRTNAHRATRTSAGDTLARPLDLLRVTPHQVEECQDERPRHRELVRRARHEEEEEEQGACRSRDERSRDSLFATRDAPIVPSLRRPAADVSCRRRERDAKQIGGRDRETASPDRR